jgi:hypothetical protein
MTILLYTDIYLFLGTRCLFVCVILFLFTIIHLYYPDRMLYIVEILLDFPSEKI